MAGTADAILETAGQPVLFHCTAGKDRTGFAAAITLHLLRVPKEVIINDYLLNNHYYLPAYQGELDKLRHKLGDAVANFVKPMAEVRSEYLQAAYQSIDNIFGCFDVYVRDGLGLHDGDIAILKEYLLI